MITIICCSILYTPTHEYESRSEIPEQTPCYGCEIRTTRVPTVLLSALLIGNRH